MQGSGPAIVFYDPTSPSHLNDLTARMDLGHEVEMNGNRYIYVQHHQGTDAVATKAGQPAFWRSFGSSVVTADKTDNEDGASNPSGCAGIYQAVVTHLNYTWLIKRGLMTGVVLDGNGAVDNGIWTDDADSDTLHTVPFATAGADADISSSPIVGIQKTAPGGSIGTVLLMIV